MRKVEWHMIALSGVGVEAGQCKADGWIHNCGMKCGNVKRRGVVLKVIVLFRHIGFGGLFVCGGYRWRLLIGWCCRLCVFG